MFSCFNPPKLAGFLVGVGNMGRCAPAIEEGGGFLKFDRGVGGLSHTLGEDRGLKTVLKNTCEEAHLLVKLLAVSLQACKFTNNDLHAYSSRILARF